MSTEAKVVGAHNPLLDIVPGKFESFKNWKERWDATFILAERLGLLYYFTMESGWFYKEQAELVSFLMEIADGHRHTSNFQTSGERFDYHGEDIAKNRQKIAEKAFAVLCTKFFKAGERYDNEPLWWWMLGNDAVFQKVLWFLRLDDTFGSNQARNHDFYADKLSHPHDVFRRFINEFIELGWEEDSPINRSYGSPDDAALARLVVARPLFIELLNNQRNLNWLNRRSLDAASIKKLTEIAMSHELHMPPCEAAQRNTYRKPKTLEEAILGGSAAAQVIILWRIRKEEAGRIEEQYDASYDKVEAAARKRELAEIERRKKDLAAQERQLREEDREDQPGK